MFKIVNGQMVVTATYQQLKSLFKDDAEFRAFFSLPSAAGPDKKTDVESVFTLVQGWALKYAANPKDASVQKVLPFLVGGEFGNPVQTRIGFLPGSKNLWNTLTETAASELVVIFPALLETAGNEAEALTLARSYFTEDQKGIDFLAQVATENPDFEAIASVLGTSYTPPAEEETTEEVDLAAAAADALKTAAENPAPTVAEGVVPAEDIVAEEEKVEELDAVPVLPVSEQPVEVQSLPAIPADHTLVPKPALQAAANAARGGAAMMQGFADMLDALGLAPASEVVEEAATEDVTAD